MKFQNLCLSVVITAALAACGSGSTATAEERNGAVAKPVTTVVVYTDTSAIKADKKLPVVIDFNATWCGPCHRFAPIFEAVAKEYKDKAIFMSVDVDQSPKTARQFEVSAIPQISILMPDGTVTSTVGFMEKERFTEFLSKTIK